MKTKITPSAPPLMSELQERQLLRVLYEEDIAGNRTHPFAIVVYAIVVLLALALIAAFYLTTLQS